MGAHGPTEKEALNGLFGEIKGMMESGELKEVDPNNPADWEDETEPRECKFCDTKMECVGGDEGGAETHWCPKCGAICIVIDGDEEWKQRSNRLAKLNPLFSVEEK